ncbi:MAG TPA: diaminopimelate epimerase [Cellulomonas sp.]
MTRPGTPALHVVKGHGTKNDFVLLDGRAGDVDLTEDLVRALSDRRAGVGGDGVIRLVASERVPDGAASLAEDPAATWFMDYRNADGSLAQMCGNGVRVFATWLERLGLWDPAAGDLVVGTRAGAKRIRQEEGPDADPWYAVDMGTWSLPGGGAAVAAGGDVEVSVRGLAVARPALRVEVGNPHVVLAVASPDELDGADLAVAPVVTPPGPEGQNVELVLPLGERTEEDGTRTGLVAMRVFERGVGETQSCGTGAVAAALAVRAWAGDGAPDVWRVHVPGGALRVTALPNGHVELAGPAVLVADLEVDWLALAG